MPSGTRCRLSTISLSAKLLTTILRGNDRALSRQRGFRGPSAGAEALASKRTVFSRLGESFETVSVQP